MFPNKDAHKHADSSNLASHCSTKYFTTLSVWLYAAFRTHSGSRFKIFSFTIGLSWTRWRIIAIVAFGFLSESPFPRIKAWMFCLLFTSKPRSRASLHIWTVRMLDISSGNVGSLDLALIDASKHSREHAAKLEMFLSKCGDMWNENISGCVCRSFSRGDKRYMFLEQEWTAVLSQSI